jgi:hypothetical protein
MVEKLMQNKEHEQGWKGNNDREREGVVLYGYMKAVFPETQGYKDTGFWFGLFCLFCLFFATKEKKKPAQPCPIFNFNPFFPILPILNPVCVLLPVKLYALCCVWMSFFPV